MSKFLISFAELILVLTGLLMLDLHGIEAVIFCISSVVFMLIGWIDSSIYFNRMIDEMINEEEEL